METRTLQYPQIANDCPYIRELFEPDRVDEQIEKYSKDPKSQSLSIFLDWKKVLDEEMTLEKFNQFHKLTDLR